MNTFVKKNREMIKPTKLKSGDTIGLITPASAISNEKLDKAIKNIEALNFKVSYNDSVLSKTGYLAGTDKERIDELHSMFENKKINAIMCARGGYGTLRILPLIDYDIIKKNPKIFIGFSDITALLQAIYVKTGLVCFHGTMGVSDFTDFTIQSFENALISQQNKFAIDAVKFESKDNLPPEFEPYTINSGTATGKLFGGNLSLLTSLIGTPYDIDYTDKLIFIEEVGEEPYRIDRMLTHLILAGKLQKAAGIILGVFKNCNNNNEKDFSLRDVIFEKLKKINIPTAYGLKIGHIPDNATIPIGINAFFDADKRELITLETATQNQEYA